MKPGSSGVLQGLTLPGIGPGRGTTWLGWTLTVMSNGNSLRAWKAGTGGTLRDFLAARPLLLTGSKLSDLGVE
eukprot:4821449-Heterocapsa_arctica.AAC.1